VLVSLFITCYNDTLFPQTGKAVVRVLRRLGHSVEFPLAQTCCGQMHYNTGHQAEALPLLRCFVAQFKDAETVVVPSSSCVVMMRDHYPIMVERTTRAQIFLRTLRHARRCTAFVARPAKTHVLDIAKPVTTHMALFMRDP